MVKSRPRAIFTQRMFEAPDAMILDMLAAMARTDYEDRRFLDGALRPDQPNHRGL